MPEQREPQVPQPNSTECGFWAERLVHCKLDRRSWKNGGQFECDLPPAGRTICGFGQIGRALYRRQKAEGADA